MMVVYILFFEPNSYLKYTKQTLIMHMEEIHTIAGRSEELEV